MLKGYMVRESVGAPVLDSQRRTALFTWNFNKEPPVNISFAIDDERLRLTLSGHADFLWLHETGDTQSKAVVSFPILVKIMPSVLQTSSP